jgi:hypothetical protein
MVVGLRRVFRVHDSRGPQVHKRVPRRVKKRKIGKLANRLAHGADAKWNVRRATELRACEENIVSI